LASLQKTTLDLEQFKEPTLHKIVFWQFQLLKHLKFVINDVINDNDTIMTSKGFPSIIFCKCLLTSLVQEKTEFDVHHVVATNLDLVMKNHMRKMEVSNTLVVKAKTKLRVFVRSIGIWKVLANLDHKKDDATATPQKKRCTDDTTSTYDEFEDILENFHDYEVEILVVSNLNARIELEFNMYETYKVTNFGKNEIIATVSSTLLVNQETTAKFNILLWWKLKKTPTLPIMFCVARSVLCIHAFSSKLESNFSDARNTLTKMRSKLKHAIVNDILLSDPTKTWCRWVMHITQFFNT
jgi:hypothetical protein